MFGSVVRWLLLSGNFYDVFIVDFVSRFSGVFGNVRSLFTITITSFHVQINLVEGNSTFSSEIHLIVYLSGG